ncbi:AraC family transcriptional regulator [Klebsiella aerogenes]|uniref:AraC family transcriptional regulator n=1 Tax=Klebsiella aerogenes TaxID=548 RepID=UPI003890B1D6|nr:AraC family transcriptional regulator [Klebsiella aerogenes]
MPQDYRKKVFKAIDYINDHLCVNPTLDEIASEVAVSSFHFHRIFKAQVGETVAAFTRRLRMEKAAMHLIESPYGDITGLALQIGFSSSQNFAKAFRQHFSLTPGEFRRRFARQEKSKPGNVSIVESDYSQSDAMLSTWDDAGFIAAGVEYLPAVRLAYMRRFGQYGKETCQQTHADLLALFPDTPLQPGGMICLYWDSPEVTPELRCRTDVCVELAGSVKTGREIAVQTRASGRYAICKFAVYGENLDTAWDIAFAWVNAQGYLKGDGPCYEKYYPETDVSRDYYVFDIGIPLKNTPAE